MNERIKEVALECYTPYGNFDLEKFAQLIIQKCCEISDEVERADVPVVASKFVKAHFGVE
jgi:hypothetical protein